MAVTPVSEIVTVIRQYGGVIAAEAMDEFCIPPEPFTIALRCRVDGEVFIAVKDEDVWRERPSA